MRIRLGESWKHNPAWVRALQALAEGRSRGFSPRDIVDVLGIEVDGVDLAQGRAEASLLDAMAALVRAARATATADGLHRVALSHAPVELRLEREGGALRLTLWSTTDDAPIVQDVGVEPIGFFEAVRDAARTFIEDLVAIHPALASLRLVQELSRELERRPARRRRVTSPSARRVTRVAGAPAFTLSQSAALGSLTLGLREGRPAVMVLDDRQRAIWTRAGDPLATLTALAKTCGTAAPPDDVAVDRRLLTVRFGRGESVPLAALRDALTRLAAELPDGEAIQSALAEVATAEPSRALPHAPGRAPQPRPPRAPGLPSDGLRRLLLRPAWKVDAPAGRPRLARCQGGVLVATGSHAELRAADGTRQWTAAVGDAHVVTTSEGVFVVGRDSHGALVLLDAATGKRSARAPAAMQGHLRHAFAVPGGWTAAHDGTHLVALRPGTSEAAWSFEAGGAARIVAAAAWSGIVVGTDRGDLLALDADGAVAWRTDAGLALVEHLAVDDTRGIVVATGLDADGHAMVAALGLEGGRKLHATTLDGVRPSEPVLRRGRLFFGYETAGGGVLAAYGLTSGRMLWQAHPPDEGHVTPVTCGEDVAVARSGGALAVYAASGALRWHCAPPDPDPALSPVRPRLPVFGAHLAVMPAALVHVFDAATGRSVASIEPSELAPESVCLLDGPLVVAAGREGVVEAWRASGHLAVVR